MKKLQFLILSSLLCISVEAQEILIHEAPENYTYKAKRGPNLSHFEHLYVGTGSMFFTEETDSIELRYPQTWKWYLGYRYKKRLCEFVSLGIELEYAIETYDIKQNKKKGIPDTLIHKKEKIEIQKIGSDVYVRLNWKKRGNFMGTFLDLGLGYHHSFHFKYLLEDEINQIKRKTINKGYRMHEPWTLKYFARLGHNRFIMELSYNAGRSFRKRSAYPDFPPLGIALELALF
jgi:hypothetical protein